jgi:alkanesulfonate monooxygenase SsuD/methylene tetrahydromethanopterin reductase-like flavin-dependent oxidoreductase (luciferase family)
LAAGFGAKLAALIAYLHGRFPAGHRFAGGATPTFATAPPLWVMGSGAGSASIAARHGANYAYSLFHRGSQADPAVTAAYREAHPDGRVAVAATCICADTEARAAAQLRMVEAWLGGDMRVVISGTPERCREQALAMAHRFGANEMVLLHAWHEPAPRLAAVHAMAELFGLHSEVAA